MISTHILDTTLGKPASQVKVSLEIQNGSSWSTVGADQTNSDGRISFSSSPQQGVYRLSFMTTEYFKNLGQESFFENAIVTFRIDDTSRKYHVPLLLNPFSYSTYRGS